MIPRSARILWLALVFALVVAPAFAQPPGGPEFQVNAYTPNDQDDPDLCVLDDGSFVVVWESNEQEGHNNGVFGQRYAADGSPLAAEFQVNTYTTDGQSDPAVCCSAAGFVVAWNSYQQDGEGAGIFGQRFSPTGGALGGEFQVNSYTTSHQYSPDVCCQVDGQFVVVWDDYGRDGGGRGVFGQAFASSGAPDGPQFQVNTYTVTYQSGSEVCCDGTGGFVVVWESQEQDGEGPGVFAQAFSSPGSPDGAEFQVNTYTIGFQGDAVVCCDADGFAVVWEDTQPGGDTNQLTGRLYDPSGAPRTDPFVVSAYTSSDADDPAVACGPNGDLFVAWETDSSDTPQRDGDDQGVFARLFSKVTILEVPTLGGWSLGLLATALAVGGAAFLRRR